METIKERVDRLNGLDPDVATALTTSVMDAAIAVFENVQTPEEWVRDEQELSITLPAGDWFRIITGCGSVVTLLAPMLGMGHTIGVDTAHVIQKVVSQLAAEKAPVTVP